MNKPKPVTPVTPEEAVAIVTKRRNDAREYYFRIQEQARRYREANDTAEIASTEVASDRRPTGGTT